MNISNITYGKIQQNSTVKRQNLKLGKLSQLNCDTISFGSCKGSLYNEKDTIIKKLSDFGFKSYKTVLLDDIITVVKAEI